MARPLWISVWIIGAALWEVGTLGAVITAQFAGQVSGKAGFPMTVGNWMTGCFTYDSSVTTGLQSAGRTILAISIPQEDFHFRRESFGFGIFDNWTMGIYPEEITRVDGLTVEFPYPGGYGYLSLTSKDTAMFTSQALPTSIPALERFDAGRGLALTIEEVQPYQTVVMRIDYFHERVAVAPAARLTSEISGDEIKFQFTGSPSSTYIVEATDSLFPEDWRAVQEVAGIAGGFAVRREFGQRFFRIRELPCECL